MIDQEIFTCDKSRLIYWLRFEAGSSNPDYFHAKKPDGLKLQQVPEEYAELLLFFKQRNIKSYLELGIGNGGSFAMNCFFMQDTLEKAVAVDDFSYRSMIKQSGIEVSKFIEMVQVNADINFVNSTTNQFFAGMSNDYKFDAIFIDADHSYEGAKGDYLNALQHINPKGIIIFHDINSDACPGIKRLWKEVKEGKEYFEFIDSKTCGIGIIII